MSSSVDGVLITAKTEKHSARRQTLPARPLSDTLSNASQDVHDRLEIVGDDDGPIRGFSRAAVARFRRVGSVIRDCRVRIFELVAGQHTDDSVTACNHAFFAEQFGAGDTGGTGRFASETARAHLRFCVQNRVVGDFAADTVADR